jgi:hypothetical protein
MNDNSGQFDSPIKDSLFQPGEHIVSGAAPVIAQVVVKADVSHFTSLE